MSRAQQPASPAPVRRSAALVHDFFIQDGGAERCAVEFARLLPQADIKTTFFDAARFGDRIDPVRVRTWPLQRILGPTPRFRGLLPLYPLYFGALDLTAYDLVLSSSVAFAKAVRTRPDACHVSYVYTPMRYAWDLETYLATSSLPFSARLAAGAIRPLLRRWDVRTGQQPDLLVAISDTVRRRIEQNWRRESEVIYPPVDTSDFAQPAGDDGYYVIASRLVGYRRVDLAVEACTLLHRPLIVIGEGPERERLQALAGPSVRFAGRVSREHLIKLVSHSHGYLVPGVEDFGIAPVEAMAAGKPVIAIRAGGVTETVEEGTTGVFFDEAAARALATAIMEAEQITFRPELIRGRALRFDRTVFLRRWRETLSRLGAEPMLESPERV